MNKRILAFLPWLRSALVIWFLAVPYAIGHEIRPAVVTITIDRPASEIEISANVEAMIAGISPKHSDTTESPNAQRYDALRKLSPDELETKIYDFAPDLIKGLAIEVDGVRITPELVQARVPEAGDIKLARISSLRLRAPIPADAKNFRWSMSRDLGDNVLRIRETGVAGTASAWLTDGDWSDPYVFGKGIRQRSAGEVMLQYATLGFTHILPKGLDHILFVLGLYLLSMRWKPLLVQVTAFTVAHSITLGLSIYGIFSLPPSIVEPLIALSIAYVAIENVMTARMHPWRPVVVFCFGLLHGMGFAGVLQEVGLPRSEFTAALIAFNVGVEMGQLAVIALAFATTGLWLRNKKWYRRGFVVPLSLLIAAIGLYWTGERVYDFWIAA